MTESDIGPWPTERSYGNQVLGRLPSTLSVRHKFALDDRRTLSINRIPEGYKNAGEIPIAVSVYSYKRESTWASFTPIALYEKKTNICSSKKAKSKFQSPWLQYGDSFFEHSESRKPKLRVPQSKRLSCWEERTHTGWRYLFPPAERRIDLFKIQ